MNCARVDDLLLEYVEDALDDADRRAVDTHLSRCAACQRRLGETRELVGDLAQARQASLAGSSCATEKSEVMVASWPPGTRLGDFEIIAELGRGGMGTVYRARQLSLNRTVALKVLSAAMAQTPGLIKRFVTEAHAAAKLHHTNIVAVYAQGEHDAHLFYAMELIDGEGLERVMRRPESGLAPRQPSRDYRRLARLISEAADALQHAHAQGVIHRDIKPQNILLGRDGRLHVTDFGLARLLDEPGVTISGEMLGTPAYMSPEQVGADRRKIDHRTDLFSLGVTFYEMLTGSRPFDGVTRDQVVARICTTEPVSPRKLDNTIPIDLETICLRALEKDPARRYQSADELAADLRRFAENQPIRARRVGPIEKAIKWSKRNPGPTAVMALSVAMLAGGVVWGVQYRRHQREQADRLVAQAWNLLAYEDYREPAEARGLLEQAGRLGPSDHATYLAARALSVMLEDKEEAIRLLQQSLAIRPDDQETMYLLAWALFRNDQFVEQREITDRADALGDSKSAAAHFFRGQSRLRQFPDEAPEEFRRAIGKRKNYAQAMMHLGRANNQWMYHTREPGRWDEQQRYLPIACQMLEKKAYPRYLWSIANRLMAEIYVESGRTGGAGAYFETAREYATEAQRLEPENPRGYAAEAEYWESRGDFGKAVEARNRGLPHLKSKNDKTEFYEYRWRLLYWQKRFDDALADLRALTEITPSSAPRRPWFSHYFQALVLAEQDHLAEAVRLTTALPTSQPANPIAVMGAAAQLRVLGRSAEADRLLDEYRDRIDFRSVELPNVPAAQLQEVYEFCRGQRTWAQLDALARRDPASTGNADPTWLLSIAAFFDGCRELGQGNRETAQARFRQADACYDDEGFCYLARVFVRRMAADPAWPHWIHPAD